jgi:D-inositol-3-phosphate glycosyltransferase
VIATSLPCTSLSSTPLRIAMISEHASPLASVGSIDAGGQNIYVAHVCEHLARAGHFVDVFTRRDNAELPAIVNLRPRLRVIHVDAGPAEFIPKEQLLQHMPEFADNMECFIQQNGPYDIAHANFFMSGWVARELKRSLDLPFVITFHALGRVRLRHQKDADAFPAERSDIEEELVAGGSAADLVIAECPQDKRDLARLYRASASRLRVVPCGVDLREFRALDRDAAREKLGLSRTEFIVLQLGRLVPRKGIDNVIRAISLLPSGVPARLLVVGGDARCADDMRTPELDRLRAIARQGGVEARVDFIGQRRRDELALYYAAADVFVSTPWYEPFGITPLEAMACARPVIGSRVGGIKYSVVDGRTGFLVPPHHPGALAERLARLHADPALAAALGAAGARRVRASFTWEKVGANLGAVYGDALRSKRRGSRQRDLQSSSAQFIHAS